MKRRSILAALAALALVVPVGAAFGGDQVQTVDAIGEIRVVPNQLISADFRFDSGSISAVSGERVRWRNLTGFNEIHTVTIVRKSELPQTPEEVFGCGGPGTPCELGFRHFNESFEPVRRRLNVGAPGLDRRGDSLLLLPRGESGQSISAVVSASPGRTLSYMCAIHPWMQGSIEVRER